MEKLTNKTTLIKISFSMRLSIIELILVEYSALTYVEHLPRVLILEEMVQDEDTRIEMHYLKI